MRAPGLVPLLVLAAGPLAAQNNALSRTEVQSGWVLLFDGGSLFGWTREGNANWGIVNGALTPGGESGWLRSSSAFADFALHFEFLAASRWDGDIVLRADEQLDKGYRIKLGDRVALNQWHKVEIEANGDHYLARLDGTVVHDSKNVQQTAGYIRLEYQKGHPVAFRSIKLRPLNLKDLFNGKDLDGWAAAAPPPKKPGTGPLSKLTKMVKSSKPKEPPLWNVTNGAIRVEKRAGRLQSLAMYDDFVLQLQIHTRAKAFADSGVRFRQDPKIWEAGYDSHKLQSPRKANIPDNEFFLETLIARGRQMAVWIDGRQLSDWYDPRAESPDASKGARTAAGGIALETLDSGVSPEFRGIRIAAIPKGGPPPAVTSSAPPVPTPAPPAAAGAGPPAVAPPAVPPLAVQVAPGQPAPENKQAEVAKLLLQALNTPKPEEQVELYKQILAIDPSNQVANSNLKEAEAKIENAKAAEAQQLAQQVQQKVQAAKQAEQDKAKAAAQSQAAAQAKAAVVAGDLKSAAASLAAAKKFGPLDPEMQRLDSLVQSKLQLRNQLTIGAGVAGVLALLGLIVLMFRKRGQKEPYLEALDGLIQGRRFGLDKEVIHIGAIAQDGGQKNEIVIADPERMISRFHCEIHRKGKKLYLVDCKSGNGTYVDRKRLRPGQYYRLKNGSRVRLAGACTLKMGFEKRREQK